MGPVMTDVFTLLGRGALRNAPFKKFDLERLPSYHAFQRGYLRFVLSQKISSSGVVFKVPARTWPPDAD